MKNRLRGYISMADRFPKAIKYIFIGIVVGIVFGVVTFHQLKVGDYQPHLNWARELGSNGYTYLRANILFQRLVLVVRDLMPFNFLARISVLFKQIIDIKSYDISALIVIITSYLATFFILYFHFKDNEYSKYDQKLSKIALVFASIVLMVGPISVFSYPDRQYMAYFNGNPYHNPTYLLMRPFALLFFISSLKNVYEKRGLLEIVFGSVFLFLTSIAKPSFTLSIVPSILLVLALRWSSIKKINYKFVSIAIILTSLIVLISQFIIMYTGERGDRVIFSPFEAILIYVKDVPTVLFSGLLSIVFPLVITIIYWQKIKLEFSFQLAWANFLLSLPFAYLLTEEIDMGSVNFWWTPMIAVFILFLVTLKIFLGQVHEQKFEGKEKIIKVYFPSLILIAHIICGVVYYVSSIFSTGLVK
jgi:hypothetical protein